jgi:hypothetical protein
MEDDAQAYLGVLLERLVSLPVEERQLGLVLWRSAGRPRCTASTSDASPTPGPPPRLPNETLPADSPAPTSTSTFDRSSRIHSSWSRLMIRFVVLCPCATVYFLSVSGVSTFEHASEQVGERPVPPRPPSRAGEDRLTEL